MHFPDYVNTLKNHFHQTISNAELCGLLFDSIIKPANLTNRNGEILTIEKAEISRILNHKKNLPTALLDHVYDKVVLDNISEYFKSQIVAALIPDTSDLCHQLLKLIDTDDSISPSHKANLRILAHPDSVAAFLAGIFIYVIRQPNKFNPEQTPPITSESPRPILILSGISTLNKLTDDIEVARFHPKSEFSLHEYEHKIRELYDKISHLKVSVDEFSTFEKLYPKLSYVKNWGSPVKIDEESRTTIELFAEKLNIQLSEDFFELGDVRRDHPLALETTVSGNDRGQEKYAQIHSLLENIESYERLVPVDKAFDYIYHIRLALNNTGNSFDENITVRLIIDRESLLLHDDLNSKLDRHIIREILVNFRDTFRINRSVDYLDCPSLSLDIANIWRLPPLSEATRNLAQEWTELFPYFMSTNNGLVTVEINFHDIKPHTAIAFPTVILLKEFTPSIQYEISSKSTLNIISGTLKLTKKF